MIRAIPGADGWVHTIITQEVHSEQAVEVPADEVVLAEEPTVMPPLLRMREDGRLSTPHDDRVAWRRLRLFGRTGPEAAALARQHRDLGGLPDVGPVTVRALPGRGFAHDFDDVPGLRVRPLTADDLEPAAAGAVESGLQHARCPDEAAPCCRPPEAHAWFRLAERIDRDDTWQLVLEHDGRPLQMELILVNGDQAVFSYTTHFTRERPHWFWREAERPVFERLRSAGVTRIHSRTRKDRPDWIQALKDNYGAVDDGVWDDKTVRLRFDPDEALKRCTGWPARRTAGQAWAWAQGPIKVWEGTEADLPAVEALIEQIGSESRRAFIRERVKDWWHLDRATLVLSARDGELTTARLIRSRREGKSGLFVFSPLTTERLTHHRTALAGVKEWHRRAGYSKITYHTPEGLREGNATLVSLGAREVAKHTKFRTPLTEWEIDV
jgi:hypothetical protein